MEVAGGEWMKDGLFARLEFFITEWNSAKTLPPVDVGKWEKLFTEWSSREQKSVNAPASSVALLDPNHIAAFAMAFPSVFHAYRKSGMTFNVWKAAQIGSNELRNCKILATLLDHSREHGQGSEILCRLLSTLKLPDFKELAARNRYYTRTEVWPLGDPQSRVDIEIEGDDFLIFIEAKIAAHEAKSQLQRYLELARIKAGRRNWVVIYLTPNGRNTTDEGLQNDNKIRPASWSQVSSVVRDYTTSLSDSPIRHTLLQYAEFAGCFVKYNYPK